MLFNKEVAKGKVDWSNIKYLNTTTKEELQNRLDLLVDIGTLEEGTTADEYLDVYEDYKLQNEQRAAAWESKEINGITNDDLSINDLTIQRNKGSNWYKYRLHLKKIKDGRKNLF